MAEPAQQGQNSGGGNNDQGQGQGQQQGQQPTPPTPAPIDTNAIAAAARRDGEGTGYAQAAKDLGVSIDEAKRIIADHRKRSDAEKTAEQRLQERDGELTAAREESGNHKKRADRYEKIVKANVEGQIQHMPEDIKDLLANFDVGNQFEWLTKHGAKYLPTPEGQQTETPGTPPQDLRGPDATRRDRIPGLNDANQQMNDILRERGLSGGVSLQ